MDSMSVMCRMTWKSSRMPLPPSRSRASPRPTGRPVAGPLLSTDRHRSALVEALITGGVTDHGPVWEVAKLLDLPYEGSFLVVVAENTALGAEPLVGVEARPQPHDVASAWRLQPDHQVGVV